jgi:site-specific recombinase XerC
MKANRPNLLANLPHNFFGNHLNTLRAMSPHTIQSYRDSMVLLMRFMASYKNRQVSSLDLEDLGPQEI